MIPNSTEKDRSGTDKSGVLHYGGIHGSHVALSQHMLSFLVFSQSVIVHSAEALSEINLRLSLTLTTVRRTDEVTVLRYTTAFRRRIKSSVEDPQTRPTDTAAGNISSFTSLRFIR